MLPFSIEVFPGLKYIFLKIYKQIFLLWFRKYAIFTGMSHYSEIFRYILCETKVRI